MKSSRAYAAGAALLVVFGLGGCSADDVELNGKIFDAVGMSSATKTKAKEPKMVARAPLVVPPGLDRLPQPGEAQPQATEVAALADPDKVAVNNQAELERQQAEYCRKHYELAKAHGDNEADMASGPLGPCRGSVWGQLKDAVSFGGAKQGEGQDGQVEE